MDANVETRSHSGGLRAEILQQIETLALWALRPAESAGGRPGVLEAPCAGRGSWGVDFNGLRAGNPNGGGAKQLGR